MLKEFRDFIAKGNVLDMAIGVVMATAFTTIVNSLVNDIIMPFVGVKPNSFATVEKLSLITLTHSEIFCSSIFFIIQFLLLFQIFLFFKKCFF